MPNRLNFAVFSACKLPLLATCFIFRGARAAAPGRCERRIRGLAAWGLFLWSALALSGPRCLAQAPIVPSLPEAPLPHRRVLLLFPGFETVQDPNVPVATLRIRQKFEMAYRKTVDPSFLIESTAFAGFDSLAGYGPNYGKGSSAYAQLVGYNAANLGTTFLFTDGLLPTIFHQDPRYFRKGEGSFSSRIWWALRSEAVGFSDQGAQETNYSSLLGFAMSTALSNAYSPPSSVTFGKTMERYGVKVGVSFLLNVLREFGGQSTLEKNQQATE
jgi:hypothetical protein